MASREINGHQYDSLATCRFCGLHSSDWDKFQCTFKGERVEYAIQRFAPFGFMPAWLFQDALNARCEAWLI